MKRRGIFTLIGISIIIVIAGLYVLRFNNKIYVKLEDAKSYKITYEFYEKVYWNRRYAIDTSGEDILNDMRSNKNECREYTFLKEDLVIKSSGKDEVEFESKIQECDPRYYGLPEIKNYIGKVYGEDADFGVGVLLNKEGNIISTDRKMYEDYSMILSRINRNMIFYDGRKIKEGKDIKEKMIDFMGYREVEGACGPSFVSDETFSIASYNIFKDSKIRGVVKSIDKDTLLVQYNISEGQDLEKIKDPKTKEYLERYTAALKNTNDGIFESIDVFIEDRVNTSTGILEYREVKVITNVVDEETGEKKQNVKIMRINSSEER